MGWYSDRLCMAELACTDSLLWTWNALRTRTSHRWCSDTTSHRFLLKNICYTHLLPANNVLYEALYSRILFESVSCSQGEVALMGNDSFRHPLHDSHVDRRRLAVQSYHASIFLQSRRCVLDTYALPHRLDSLTHGHGWLAYSDGDSGCFNAPNTFLAEMRLDGCSEPRGFLHSFLHFENNLNPANRWPVWCHLDLGGVRYLVNPRGGDRIDLRLCTHNTPASSEDISQLPYQSDIEYCENESHDDWAADLWNRAWSSEFRGTKIFRLKNWRM